MKRPAAHLGLVVGAFLLMTPPHDTSTGTVSQPDTPARAVQPADTRSSDPGPRTELLVNDPVRDRHVISDAIAANIEATPAGEAIEVSTFVIDSEKIADALVRADRRGVAVHVIVARNMMPRSATSRSLARALNAAPARSWLRWSVTAARGPFGMMHEKTFRFSRAGAARWITMTGSYNASERADRASYATMWQVVGRRDIYDRFADVFAQQRAQRSLATPYRAYDGDDWSAYFFPEGPRGPARDPVLQRLAAIPARPATEIRVVMFSMWEARGTRIAERLAALARGGARISLVAGPTVSSDVIATLRSGGVRVRSGCFADGSYAHGKDMSASYVVDGRRESWTWIGSDNWTSRAVSSDQAVLGLRGVGSAEFGDLFARLMHRTDGVYGEDCQARLAAD